MSKIKRSRPKSSTTEEKENKNEMQPKSSILTSSSLPNVDIFKIFTEVQWTESFHDKYVKKLKKIYEQTPFKIFVDDFTKCLAKTCINSDKILEKNVELILQFAAKFTVSICDPDNDETCPFLTKIFDFFFENHDCYDTAVRLHCCQFINCLLTTFGSNASLDINIYEKISSAMMERLQDKVPSVRAQAVFALRRLQDPSDENCQVIEVLLYHMTRDPSPDVRCAVVNNIVKIRRTLIAILSRIDDCKDDVRKEAFTVCSNFSIQKFSIRQRQNILNSGFLDPSNKLKDFVKNELLPKWLSIYKEDYVQFIKTLNVQSELGLEVSVKCLNAFFYQTDKYEMVEYLLEFMKQKTIPYDAVNPEVVLFWRTLIQYLQPLKDSEKGDELLEKVLPDLTFFTGYIKGFFILFNYSGSSVNSDDEIAKCMEKEFILIQLLEMTKCYELADEFGRKNLSDLCIVLLKHPQVTLKSIPIIINRLSWAIPDVTERISSVVELISELREPFFDMDATANSSFNETRNTETMRTQLNERLIVLQNERLEASRIEDFMISKEIENEISSIEKKLAELQRNSTDIPVIENYGENIDPVVVTKCLKIINEMIDSRDVTELTPTLHSLFDNVVLPDFKKNLQNATVSSLSLETFSMFCLLDAELARERFIVLCFLISSGSLTVPALKAVFDLLQKYGLRIFHLSDEDNINPKEEKQEDTTKSDSRESSSKFSTEDGKCGERYVIPLLYSLLDSDSKEVRNVASEGLCKLLLIGHLRSHTLVAKLVSLWFSPVSDEDTAFRQRLSMFFKAFVMTHGAQLILEKAFLPTLQLFFDASPDNPLSEVDIDSVVQLLINLTHPDLDTSLPKDYCVHNQLAVTICNELLLHLRNNSREKNTVFVRALTHLTLKIHDIDFIKELCEQANTLVQKYKSMGEKNCHRYALKFNVRLNILKRELELKLAESDICNTLTSTKISERISTNTGNNSKNISGATINDASDSVTSSRMEEDSSNLLNKNEDDVSVVDVDSNAGGGNDDDDDSSIDGNNKFSRYHKKITQINQDTGIIISSSDFEDTDNMDNENSDCSGEIRKSDNKEEDLKEKSNSKKGKQKKIKSSQSSISHSSTSSQSSQITSSPSECFSSPSVPPRYNTRSARKLKK
ncbi:chromosome associated protein G [Lycorma delicatula]|uniref:chromosome associated protein G n=1 Tax=Lycorma delicatula TaxID=130591 RepID=UPI003F51AA38